MIHVDFVEPTDPKWIKWRARAEKATKLLEDYLTEAAGRDYDFATPPRISEAMYKYPHQWLVEAFNGKCAFCESHVEPQQSGDVEHFRPKGAVQEADGTSATFVSPGGVSRQHPGYFWLAYDWQNLLIACTICNSSNKRTFFPLKDPKKRAIDRAALKDEGRLFIHPYEDDPCDHLRFDDTGMVIPLTDEGRTCVEKLDLNRDALVDVRRDTFTTVGDKFDKCADQPENDPEFVRLNTELTEWERGKRQYAAPARESLKRKRTLQKAKLDALLAKYRAMGVLTGANGGT